MTVEARVAAFLTGHRPEAYCDDCIAKDLALGSGGNRHMARNATAGLSHGGAFIRTENVCSRCGRTKLVIRAR